MMFGKLINGALAKIYPNKTAATTPSVTTQNYSDPNRLRVLLCNPWGWTLVQSEIPKLLETYDIIVEDDECKMNNPPYYWSYVYTRDQTLHDELMEYLPENLHPRSNPTDLSHLNILTISMSNRSDSIMEFFKERGAQFVSYDDVKRYSEQ